MSDSMSSAGLSEVAIARAFNGHEQLLRDHLFNVARLAREHAAKIGVGALGELAGLVHDLGKYSAPFQNYIRSATGLLQPDEDGFVDAGALKGKVDHSTAGAQFVSRELRDAHGAAMLAAQIVCIAVASHHSGLIDSLESSPSSGTMDRLATRLAKDEASSHVDEASLRADKAILSRAGALIGGADLTSQLQDAAARICARKELSPMEREFHIGLLVRFVFSCLIDADRQDSADFERGSHPDQRQNGAYVSWETLIARLDAHRSALRGDGPVNAIRAAVSDDCAQAAKRGRGTYTLTVPTGGGKTLASLRFAMHHAREHGLERIIYVIPFTSIIDQNAFVARSILEVGPSERDRVVLEHHASLEPSVQTWRHKLSAESWDVPVVFTTMVQFLDTLFGGGTRGARRMHQLSRAVLIFDEIQTLPVRCVHLFNGALNFLVEHCGSSSVLCTATQPLLDRVDRSKGAVRLAEQAEIVRDVPALFQSLRRVDVRDRTRNEKWSSRDIAELASAEAERVGSCLVVVNTKATARGVFDELVALGRRDTLHLSTSMCPVHRKSVLKEVLRRIDENLSFVCVSTQLIEAGVDVDFGAVVRSIAGLDSVAQAAGRCNRNGRRPTGSVHIVNPEAENLDKLRDIAIGREKTRRVLGEVAHHSPAPDLLSPEVLATYYNYYFFERRAEMEYPLPADAVGHADSLLSLLSTNSLVVGAFKSQHGSAPRAGLRQSFGTAARHFAAIDAPTRGVLVPYGEDGAKLVAQLGATDDLDVRRALLRRAQQFTVNVFPHELRKLNDAGGLAVVQNDSDLYALDARFYDERFGLSVEPVAAGGLYYA